MTAVALDDRRRNRADPSGRVPPHNLEAEESLLGAMLISRDAVAVALEANVSADQFYRPAHGHIFEAVTGLYARGEPADPVTVSEVLSRANLLDAIGGAATLISLQARTPSTGNAGRYAGIVGERALLRRLIDAATAIAEMGYSVPDDVLAAVDEAEALIYGVRPAVDTPTLRSLADGTHEWLNAIEARAIAGGVVEHPCGLAALDELTGGLRPSHMTVLAARPGAGKTSLLAAIATFVAGTARPVLFVSVEMSFGELVGRMIVAGAGLEGSRIARGLVYDRDWPWIHASVNQLVGLPIEITDGATATLLSVRTAARRMASRHGHLGMIVVDYTQLMTGRGRAENRQVEVAELARGLKVLGKELDVHVLAAAQLNRDLERRADKRPMLADLRETGELENSADAVVMLYRDEMYDRDSPDRGVAELIVSKNRHGPQGTARVAADMATGRWSDLVPPEAI